MQRIVKFIFFMGIIFYLGLSYANTFNIKALGSLPTSVQAGQTVVAIYNISSVGIFSPANYHIIYALLSNPSNVTQDLSALNSCNLFPINSSGCVLQLNIVGSVSGAIKVCDDWNGSPGLNCYIPANPNDFLNVLENQSPHLAVSPPTTFLGPNISQVFTVVNISATTTATNVTMTIPVNVQTQLVGAPIYSGCDSIAPFGMCTVTITASASPTAQSGIATVQGTNTAALPPTVTITTGAAPALIISPSTTILGPNGVQQFTVVNTSTTTIATNITMAIPANVQTQLVGAPVYSGCASIAALGSCTITISASALPNAQSGIATVQGTNTAAPVPTVAITTGAAPALTVSPPTTILGPNGSQQFIVTNTSPSIAAQNITMTIPANVQTQLVGAPVYSGCASIAALGSCTITISASASPNAQSGIATVQGTNTTAPAPTVAMTTGAAPTLIVSPSSANIGSDHIQIFTVTNTGTITAQNITMTIPANVQNQLVGQPIYDSNCASLLVGSSACTITIQAIISPSSQSGIATVQGTNTAAPVPTANIFILPTCTVLGATTVTNTGNSSVTGSVCVAPGVAITGFPPGQTIPAGQLHSNDGIAVANHNEAVSLYNTIAGLTCDNPLSADLGGLILSSGVYCFNTAATLVAGGTLILNGSATDIWYIQIGTTLTTGANSNVILTGGALPGNVFWQIGSSATFGASTAFQGQVIAFTSLTLGAGTSNVGRFWVVNAAITMDTNNVAF